MCIDCRSVASILAGPVGASEGVVESFRHGVSALALELGWALRVRERLIPESAKVEVVRGVWRMVNLAFERVESVGKLFDVSGKR